MKNKKAIYALGFAVLVVWGLILYRLFHAGSANDEQGLTRNPQRFYKEALNDYSIPPDTAKLLLNYPDPFAGGAPPKEESPAAPAAMAIIVSSPAPLPKPPAIDWSFIRYAGFVKNPKSKRLVAMMNIRGKDLMLSEGETAQEVRLLKNLGDSVKVSFQRKTRIIHINTGAAK